MKRTNALAAALALAASLPAAAIDYPVDVAGTAGRWVIWDTQPAPGGAVFRRGLSWPVADGGPIPGLDPRYRYLLEVRVEPPEIDSRLQTIATPCPEAADLAAERLTVTCTAAVRPPEALAGAVENVALARIDAAVQALGIRTPADLLRGISLLEASRRGAVLSAEQSAWLSALGAAGIDYVDQVRAAQGAILAWIAAHPGQVPDLGPAVWPPLPQPVP